MYSCTLFLIIRAKTKREREREKKFKQDINVWWLIFSSSRLLSFNFLVDFFFVSKRCAVCPTVEEQKCEQLR